MARTTAAARVRSSLRYLLADFIGDDGGEPPFLPDGLPDSAISQVSDGIDLLIDYQGASYAQLYVDRLKRFVGRRGLDDTMLGEIARLMARRMSYLDPIRIAQLKLAESEIGGGRAADDILKFRLDELIGALPAAVAEPMLAALDWIGRAHMPVVIRFSARSRWGVRRLKIEAALRRWRQFSVRYASERVWVERWLHMISRSLDRRPEAASAIVQTATMIDGYGDSYRHGLADWHAIIDGLVKPALDGDLPLADLAGAVAEAREASRPDPQQTVLTRSIAEIRARALAAGATVAAD